MSSHNEAYSALWLWLQEERNVVWLSYRTVKFTIQRKLGMIRSRCTMSKVHLTEVFKTKKLECDKKKNNELKKTEAHDLIW
jgi:exosome complex RNA-binding protein Csl4